MARPGATRHRLSTCNPAELSRREHTIMTLLAINWAETGIQAAQFIVSFSIIVVLHEMGHFLPAKWFKCRIEKFYLFFNPWFSLVKKKIGETEYGLGWIP